ncbi:MAG: hypothetical protein ACI4II_07780 [Acutalibacteraceae bacterium]
MMNYNRGQPNNGANNMFANNDMNGNMSSDDLIAPSGDYISRYPQDVGQGYDSYKDFKTKHSGQGLLKVQVFAARGAFPIENANVIVQQGDRNNPHIIFSGATDESGIVEGIKLPALAESLSQNYETAANSGTDYLVSVRHPNFLPVNGRVVTAYDTVETILPVLMYPVLR